MRFSTLILSLAALVAGLFLLSLITGAANIPPRASLHALLTGEGGPMALVMREIRLPRAILAVLVGVSLGLSGAVLQGYLRNPLAEPSVVGVSASAALAAVISIQSGAAALFALALPLAALLGALIGVGFVVVLAGGGSGALGLILAGVAVSALASALTSLVLNLSPNPFAANEIVFWMMGSLADRSFTHVGLAAPVMVLGWLLLARTARGLEALTLGEDAAASMGVDLRRLRRLIVFGVAATVGAATAVAGAIGFVGLIVPHVLRPLVAGRPARLLPVSALGGAALVLSADVAARLILPDRDLKLGVLMALIGAPVFLHLIWNMRGRP